jgi:hypothetical protein
MSLADTILDLAPELLHEFEVLAHLILVSDSPAEALSKAQKAVLADASDAAAHALAAKALAEGMKR